MALDDIQSTLLDRHRRYERVRDAESSFRSMPPGSGGAPAQPAPTVLARLKSSGAASGRLAVPAMVGAVEVANAYDDIANTPGYSTGDKAARGGEAMGRLAATLAAGSWAGKTFRNPWAALAGGLVGGVAPQYVARALGKELPSQKAERLRAENAGDESMSLSDMIAEKEFADALDANNGNDGRTPPESINPKARTVAPDKKAFVPPTRDDNPYGVDPIVITHPGGRRSYFAGEPGYAAVKQGSVVNGWDSNGNIITANAEHGRNPLDVLRRSLDGERQQSETLGTLPVAQQQGGNTSTSVPKQIAGREMLARTLIGDAMSAMDQYANPNRALGANRAQQSAPEIGGISMPEKGGRFNDEAAQLLRSSAAIADEIPMDFGGSIGSIVANKLALKAAAERANILQRAGAGVRDVAAQENTDMNSDVGRQESAVNAAAKQADLGMEQTKLNDALKTSDLSRKKASLELTQAERLDSALGKLASLDNKTDKDGTARRALQETILTMMGKEPKTDFELKEFGGGTDPATNMPLPKRLALFNPKLGKVDFIDGGEAGAPAKPKFEVGKAYQIPGGKVVKFVGYDDKGEPQFDDEV